MYDDLTIPPQRLADPAIYERQPDFLKESINRERFFWSYDTLEKYQTNLRAYYRMITGIDRAIGRVIAALEQAGIAENTIVVYSADNGYYLGDRGFQGKWSHYEESLRVPLVIHDPRLPKGQRGRVVDQMALNVDLPATILPGTASAAGAKRPNIALEKAGAPHDTAMYPACTYDLDASIGMLLQKLKGLGLDDNPLVVFTSDNGARPTSSPEPLRGRKRGGDK